MVTSIELVVTDLDGTLWDHEGNLHSSTVPALAELRRRGVSVLAATGRRRHSAMGALADHQIELPAVVLNGAEGWHHANDRTFHRRPFTADAACEVVKLLTDNGLEPCVYTAADQQDVVVTRRPSTASLHLERLDGHLRLGDLHQVAASETVLGFSMLGQPREHLQSAYEALAASCLANTYMLADSMYGQWTLMVQPRGIDKWTGVLAWCELEGLDPTATLAVGDGGNDIELLTKAGLGVAISSGAPAAVDAADTTIDPPEAGGWAQVIDLLG